MKQFTTQWILGACLAVLLAGCGSGGIQTNNNNNNGNGGGGGGGGGNTSMSTPETFAEATLQQNAFSLGSDFPAEIQIPEAAPNTAFIATFFPAAVVAVDVSGPSLQVSSAFEGFDASGVPEVGGPNNVLVVSPSQAFLTGTVGFAGESGLAYFNPTTGDLYETELLSDPINLPQALPYSAPQDCDGDGNVESSAGPGPFTPSFVADLAVIGSRLFVSMSNTCFDTAFESFYLRGMVRVFDIHPGAPYLTPASTPFIVLNGFNSTALTVFDGRLFATSTGDTSFTTGVQLPQTNSVLDEIDPDQLIVVATLNLGQVAANYQPLAITSDGALGFVGSSAFSELYAVDMEDFEVLRGAGNPIQIFDEEVDFISDQDVAFGDQLLFVTSFNNSAVRAIDLSESALNLLPKVLDFAFPGNPGITGAGPMALRPGQPGVDFTGPDLFVLTANPGTISTATTY